MSDSKNSIGWGYLPDEILTHIFTFLPIKSIIICTSVSTTWKSLIKNPTFISTHLHHSHNKNQNLILLSVSRNDKQVYTLHKEDGDPDFIEYTSFDSPFHAPHLQFPYQRTYYACGTFNGLICVSYGLRNRAEVIFLWNPCARKFLQLPSPDVTVDTHGASCTSFGFGFDPKTKDYKVVRILSMLGPLYFVKSRPVVDVYSLSTGEKMKNWIQAVKIVVRLILNGEKSLCDQIFCNTNETQEICFNKTVKGCVMQLLNFGEAVAIGRRSPEKLFRILDMYDVMAEALARLEVLVTDDVVINEARDVLSGLGEAACGTVAEFVNAVESEISKKPMQSGEIHPQTFSSGGALMVTPRG